MRIVALPGAVALLVILLTSACGFHLRGANLVPLPDEMKATYIEYSGGDTDIRRAAAQALVFNGAQVVSSADRASATLKLLKAATSREILSRDRNGRPQEYAITVNLKFGVVGEDGSALIEPTEVSAETVLALDTTDPLASRSELEATTESLRNDAVMQMIRAISTAAGNAGKAPQEPQ